jgi:putative acetyltransferase
VLIEIREERSGDIAAVREVNRRAFEHEQESNIVDALRTNRATLFSLVATVSDRVVGHIMYSPVTIGDTLNGAAVGPMAVLPEHQRQGIGTGLIETGNRKIKDAGYPLIIVVGHADYYPRFGFRPASEYGIKCEWKVPDNVFMVLISPIQRKCRASPDWPSIGTNFRLSLNLYPRIIVNPVE